LEGGSKQNHLSIEATLYVGFNFVFKKKKKTRRKACFLVFNSKACACIFSNSGSSLLSTYLNARHWAMDVCLLKQT
jgi:hypothetical protein